MKALLVYADGHTDWTEGACANWLIRRETPPDGPVRLLVFHNVGCARDQNTKYDDIGQLHDADGPPNSGTVVYLQRMPAEYSGLDRFKLHPEGA